MKAKFPIMLMIMVLLKSLSIAQENHTQQINNEDLRYSVFGPPRPAVWEFQLAYQKIDVNSISSFNFYRKDQRNKTLFFKISDNGLNNRNEFRVKEITGGALLFPINDDDRFQIDLGGTYDKLKDADLYSKALYSRLTYRPLKNIWIRFGSEYFDGYTTGHANNYRNTILNSNYLAGRVKFGSHYLVGVLGRGKIDNTLNTRYGGAGIVLGPFNTFVLTGYIQSDEPKENVSTISIGRFSPFRPDGLPSGFFFWKHRENYDFQLGGLLLGKNNLFVRPAAIGMSQGMFISSTALRENSKLRQGQLMSITDDYRNSEIIIFYVYLNKGIEMIPGTINHVGFRAIQLFKNFNEFKFSSFSNPVIGLFFNQETEPEFNPILRKFEDKKSNYWSFQAGGTIHNNFIMNVIHTPKMSEWTIALSYVYR
jgi:hypothetical protein